MTYVILVIIILCLLFGKFIHLKYKTEKANENISESNLPYKKIEYLLTKAEKSFYEVLNFILKDTDYKIFIKVRLADLLYVPNKIKNRISYNNKIQSKHVDFVICDNKYPKPVLAVELDDSSHNRQDRNERDEFVDKALACSDLSVLRVPAQYTYNVNDISVKIFSLINIQHNDIGSDEIAITEENCKKRIPENSQDSECFSDKTPICPKCGIPMVKRNAKARNSNGEPFWGCTNFPKCREVIPIDLTIKM